jgi:quinol monooxygenase YgiN
MTQITDALDKIKLPSDAVIVVAQVRALGGKENKLAEVTAALVPAVRTSEPGCLLFQAHRGANIPGVVLFYEIFENHTAFEAHKKAPHTQQWFSDIESLTAGPVEVNVLMPIP